MVNDFPWPITDDDLLLNNALTIVMNTLNASGTDGEALPQEEAAELIVEAYNQGIRDPEVLAQFALRALIAGGRIRR